MTSLLELDLRSCLISSIQYDYFFNLPNLEKLFLSHNNLVELNAEALSPLINLRHLDISYNEIQNDLSFLIGGMILDPNLFRNLHRLMFLDLSHTKLSKESVVAIKNIEHEIEQLSLCYTGIEYLDTDTFANKSVKVLDLSGNQELHKNLTVEHLNGLENSLEILVFRDANLQNINLVSKLKKIRMLDLRSNNVSTLQTENFQQLRDLEILDLGSNHIYDWNERLFRQNDKMRILNLRMNNITFMRDGMLNDFYEIR